jgi:2-isopropylmalate synthase
MEPEQKLEIALTLEQMGVDVIEAGFPASSPSQAKAVRMIATQVKNSIIAVLCRLVASDIKTGAECLAGANRKRIHTFICGSDVQIGAKFRAVNVQRLEGESADQYEKRVIEARRRGDFSETIEQARARVLAMIRQQVPYAKSLVSDIEFSVEDATRTPREFLIEMVRAAIESGATTINLPDTVGYAQPNDYAQMFCEVMEALPEHQHVIYSAHTHNDLGLAVANALAAIKVGVRQIECTINGIGERAGNAALEEIAMNLRVRTDYFGIDHRLDTTLIKRASDQVVSFTGLEVQRNKALVGRNAFAHEAGIHQHGVTVNLSTYEIMDPAMVGIVPQRIVLGRHSGKHGVRSRLEDLGFHLDSETFARVFSAFMAIADKKNEVTDEELRALVGEEISPAPEYYQLEYCSASGGGGVTLPIAAVRIRVGDQAITATAHGDGPIDAAYRAIQQAIGFEVKLDQFRISAKSKGADSSGESVVVIADNGHVHIGRHVSTDIIDAATCALVRALNRMHHHHSSSGV